MKTPEKYIVLILMSFTACTVEKQEGDLRVTPAPLFAHQEWRTVQQYTAPDGDRICTVNAGEINVTQRMQAGRLQAQVETTNLMQPGKYYSIMVNNHLYQTSQNYFDSKRSHRIVNDMKVADTAYTELRAVAHDNGEPWRWGSNNIPLAGFKEKYDTCTQYVKNGKSKTKSH
jgi:hypothetical protein